MPATVHHLYCEQGATFQKLLVLPGQDLTGYSARGQVRDSSGNLVVEFSVSDITVTAQTQLSPAKSSFEFSLTAEQTAALSTVGKKWSDTTRHSYDIELVFGSTVTRILNGYFEVSPEATK